MPQGIQEDIKASVDQCVNGDEARIGSEFGAIDDHIGPVWNTAGREPTIIGIEKHQHQ